MNLMDRLIYMLISSNLAFLMDMLGEKKRTSIHDFCCTTIPYFIFQRA